MYKFIVINKKKLNFSITVNVCYTSNTNALLPKVSLHKHYKWLYFIAKNDQSEQKPVLASIQKVWFYANIDLRM